MVRDLKGLDRMSAKRFILKHKAEGGESFRDKFDSIKPDELEMLEFPQHIIDAMHQRLLETDDAVAYMKSRGFTRATVEHFQVGFAYAATEYGVPVYRAHDMIMVPAYNHKSVPVGLVGRSLEGKNFKNYGAGPKGTGFHKSWIAWNLQNARKYETVIICESTFDAMRIHQAGYPNVVALLGGSLSKLQVELLNRHFSKVIIMTDNENEVNGAMHFPRGCIKCLKQKFEYCQGHKPGRDLGFKIAEALPRMSIGWAAYDDKHIYANDVKDATDMSDDEIRQCLRNQIPHFEYLDWVA
jgi:hypothetical protein